MLEILKSGIFSSFQDIGRFGLKQYGVSNSGCQDLYSFTFLGCFAIACFTNSDKESESES